MKHSPLQDESGPKKLHDMLKKEKIFCQMMACKEKNLAPKPQIKSKIMPEMKGYEQLYLKILYDLKKRIGNL
jgi:hypothetical protein